MNCEWLEKFACYSSCCVPPPFDEFFPRIQEYRYFCSNSTDCEVDRHACCSRCSSSSHVMTSLPIIPVHPCHVTALVFQQFLVTKKVRRHHPQAQSVRGVQAEQKRLYRKVGGYKWDFIFHINLTRHQSACKKRFQSRHRTHHACMYDAHSLAPASALLTEEARITSSAVRWTPSRWPLPRPFHAPWRPSHAQTRPFLRRAWPRRRP
jgi:hypothetical protein